MTQKRYLYLSFIVLSLLTGCVEKTGYYEPGESAIITNLTANKSWERTYVFELDGKDIDVHEIFRFKDDGTGSCKYIETHWDGEVKEIITTFRWSFTMPNFSVIYLDYGLFWDVRKLTADELHVYETYEDPVTVPGQSYRDYREYKACPLRSK